MNNSFKKLLISILVATSSSLVWAASITPGEVANRILLASPEAKALEVETNALQKSLLTQANLPDPEIEGEYLFAPDKDENRWGAGLSWQIEWPGVYAARAREAESRLKAARLANDATLREKSLEIKKLLLTYIFQIKQLSLLRSIELANDSISIVASNASKGGELTRLDLNKLNIEKALLKSQIAENLDATAATICSLNAIYGHDCTPLLADMECEFPMITVPSDEEITAAIEKSPTFISAQADADAARRAMKVSAMESLPSISLGYSHLYEDGTHFNGGSVGLSIPIFSTRNKKSAAQAEVALADYKALSARDAAETEITSAKRHLAIVSSRLAELAPALNTGDNMHLLLKAYQNGVITMLDYLSERTYFLDAEQNLLNLKLAEANARLELEPYFPFMDK